MVFPVGESYQPLVPKKTIFMNENLVLSAEYRAKIVGSGQLANF